MVADPVKATLDTLNYYYGQASNFATTSKENLAPTYEAVTDALLKFNPYSNLKQQTAIVYREDTIVDHISRYRYAYGGFAFASVGISGYLGYKYWAAIRTSSLPHQNSNNHNRLRRRVSKLPNGARRDVVLIIGSPTEPLTRLIALDFEKRGFIVYLTILDEKDLKYVESNPITDDINYLNLNNSYSFDLQLAKFRHLMECPVIPFPGAAAHTMKLAAVVFAPCLYFPIGPIENITIPSWDRLLTRLNLTPKFFSSGLLELVRRQKGCKIISIASNIISSLELPYHAPETLYQQSIESFFTSLTREVSHHQISVTQIRLGNLNLTNLRSSSRSKVAALVNSEVRSWDDDMRSLYARDFTKAQYKSNPFRNSKADANLRDLYHLLFDLIYPKNPEKLNPEVVYCGSGARMYEWITLILPSSFMSWILK